MTLTPPELQKQLLNIEHRGEKITGLFRIVTVSLLAISALIPTLRGSVAANKKTAILLMIAAASVYTLIQTLLLNQKKYSRTRGIITISLDLLFIFMTVFSLRFTHSTLHPQIYSSSRVLLFCLYTALTAFRGSFRTTLITGGVAALLYLIAVLPDITGRELINPLLSPAATLEAAFRGKQIILHFSLFNEFLKSLYIIATGVIVAYLAKSAREQVITNFKHRSEKDLMQVEKRMLKLAEQEQQKYLKNIGQGLLSFSPNLIIKEHYSEAVRPMFGQRRIDGIKFTEFLFGEDEEKKSDLEQFIVIAFENTTAAYEMIEAINPVQRMEYHHPDGALRHLAIRFKRVYSGERVSELMAIVDDITAMVESEQKYQEEIRHHQEEIEQIAAILKLRLSDFEEFINEGNEVIRQAKELLKSIQHNENNDVSESVTIIFRLAHTLKGNARNYKFLTIAEMAHKAEDFFAQLRDNKAELTLEILDEAEINITRMDESFRQLLRLKDQFAVFSNSAAFTEKENPEIRLGSYFDSLRELCGEMSKVFQKKIQFQTEIGISPVPDNLVNIIKNPLNHLIRNAADHALEDPQTRLQSGKEEIGTIRLSIFKEGDTVKVSLEDDGRGIDTDSVRRSAIRKGLVNSDESLNRKQLIQLLFKPGFSTRDKATDYSGRGVGLDAVKDLVTQSHGKLGLTTATGKGTRFELTYPESAFH